MEQTTLTVGTEKKQKPSKAYKSVEKNYTMLLIYKIQLSL